jgi:signal transduction histidine kinase
MPNIGNVESSVHQLVDISRSSLCIFTYIIPYRMFRERLIEARRDLEIKTEFVKYIQHEIRSPVGSLVVGLELLEAELTSETPVNLTDIIERVSEMRSTTNSVIEILDDLLLYEKLERNTVDMHLALLNPVLGMRKVLKNIGHNVEVQPFDVPLSRNWRINLDRVKMKLAINAILAQGACNAQDKDAKVEILFQLRNASHMPDVKVRRRSSLSLIVPEIDSTAHFSIVIVDRRRTNPDPSAFKYLHEEHLKFERIGHDDGRGSGIGLWYVSRQLLHTGLWYCCNCDCTLG